MQFWSLTSIFNEYRSFANPKSRSMDQQFIELFNTRCVSINDAYLPQWPEVYDSFWQMRMQHDHHCLLPKALVPLPALKDPEIEEKD
jgi:hypothetical protein